MKNITKTSKELSKSFGKIRKILKENTELFKHNKEFQNLLSGLGKSLVRVYTETPDNLLNISKYGWFLDFNCEMKYSFELNELIEKDRYDLAEKSLIEYYTENLKGIFQIISKRHPTRKKIFEQIEKSSEQELYYLAIPIIFSQIDGICYDLTSKKFFVKNENFLPEVYPKLEELHNGLTDFFLIPIKNSTPFNVWEKEINKFPLKLNRHEILHGVDTDYGNKTNFLRCISMLKYISDLTIRIDK
jgi:hypothetical protein